LEYLGVDWDNIKMGLGKIEHDGVDWSHLVQNKDQLWDLVSKAMKFRGQ
jgi:hypothetical protein